MINEALDSEDSMHTFSSHVGFLRLIDTSSTFSSARNMQRSLSVLEEGTTETPFRMHRASINT